jgi:hypothetical protein
MRRVMLIAAGLATLVTAGVAVGAGLHDARSVKAVAGTFTATGASATTRTCKTSDGKTIAVTNGRYTGTAAGDPDLAGAIRIDARSLVNTTDDVGTVEGKLRIDVASGEDTVAHFSAVYDHGKVAGLAAGRAHEPNVKLLANLSAAFSAAGGFTGGQLGGSTGGSAVELGPAKCEPAKARAEKSEAKGTVSAVSQTSITVAGLTCAVPPDMAQKVNEKVKVGDRAEIRCALVNGQNTLVRLEAKKG